MRITYVIGYRHKADRIINLRKVLEWLSGFSNMDVILVEQDTHSKISHLSLPVKHIFIKSNKPYNRSWAFNVALKRTTNPIIVFGDSDLIMDPEEFVKSINELNIYDVVSPYSSVLDLTADESNYPFNMLPKITRPGRGETDNQKINLCGGIVLFKTEAAIRIAGWNEDFLGWGGEDDFQTLKVQKIGLTWKEMPFRCYHFWHQREQSDMVFYERTMQILQQLATLDKDKIQGHINATVNKIGMLNKYA